MLFQMNFFARASSCLVLVPLLSPVPLRAQTPVVTLTNATVRVMASNLTSGSNQRYETPGLDILKGLKPDIVAMQEFNYASTNGQGINTPAALQEMVFSTFGTNSVYFRESDAGYTIPNGIISRWPMISSGSWVDVDTGVNDRGFAWARIDLPGTNDLYVVSIHLKASSGSNNPDRRNAEATNLVNLIKANFPANAWIIVAGDCNIYSTSEGAYQCLSTNFSDSPIPTDAESGGNANTSEPRSQRYDYVFPSQSFSNQLVATVFASHTFPKGLVFDSAVYSPLSDVPPVQSGDSHVTGMQHMGVMRTFNVPYYVTNYITNPPSITLHPQSQTVVQGSNVNFAVAADGTAPLSYQWIFNSTTITGATTTSYARMNAQPADAGSYCVVVTNLGGGVTSSIALLSVLVPPSINTQPAPQTANQGASATFSVSASGSQPLSYQWRFNSADLLGETASVYTRSNVQPSDMGSYSVVVANFAGSTYSSNAVLSLIVPAPLLTIPAPGIILWQGLSNLPYTVQAKTNIDEASWLSIGTAASPTTDVSFTNPPVSTQRFYRVIYP
jgi:endonuclease/exonuclease/phosphatase family metal-dependent hydrolase